MNYLSKSLQIPAELFYTKNHEWLAVDENIVTFGITEMASQGLGEVLYVDLPDEGDRINIGTQCASLEGVREIMDLIAPFSGTVLEVNLRLMDDPSLISDDTYGDGWLFTAELDNEKDLAVLIRHSEYRQKLLSQGDPSSAPA